MISKILFGFTTICLLATVSVEASSTKVSLINLAAKQESISKHIATDYKKQGLMSTIKSLEAGQNQLKRDIHNPEVKNLMRFLDMCVNDLKVIATKPYSKQNAQRVSELGESLREGHHYVLLALK